MKHQMVKKDRSGGFTLIELMIVIAIIGILAAIAIPNFIAYRNKSFCSRTESDAIGIAEAIADYFTVPSRNQTPSILDLNNGAGVTMSGNNTIATIAGDDPNANVTIIVTDGSGRCPDDYQTAMNQAVSEKGFWDGTGNYTLIIRP